MATEKLQVQKVPQYRNKHPQLNTGCVDPEGVRWSGPYPPPIPLKITCSMGFYRNKHPPPPENKQKDIYPASSQTQRGPVDLQLFSGISNVHRGNTYETFSLHLQNSIRDGEVGNYLFLTDVWIQREIGGLDTPPPPQLKINNNHKFF